jgi:hypothetical protein
MGFAFLSILLDSKNIKERERERERERETETAYVFQASLELVVLLLPPLKYCDYRCTPPCQALEHILSFLWQMLLPFSAFPTPTCGETHALMSPEPHG